MERDWDGVNVVSDLSNRSLLLEGWTCFHRCMFVCVNVYSCECEVCYLQELLYWSQSGVPNALMQEADGSLPLFSRNVFIYPSDSGHLHFPQHTIQCVLVYVCEVEFISRSNWDDISPLQIKLFSSCIHLFSSSFVPHPPTASLTLRAKNHWPQK